MENNVDEDLIEATIRRVAAQKAALEGGEDDTSAPPSARDHEATVEDTIRRVAASKAALAAAAPAPKTEEEDPIEATIRRVAAQKAALEADAAASVPAPDADEVAPEPAVVATASVEEEDPIEATIRRVQAEKAARESAMMPDADEEDEPTFAPAAAPAPASPAATAAAFTSPPADAPKPSLRSFAPPSHYEPGPPPAESPWSSRVAPAASAQDDAGDDDRLARIERKLDDVIARLDALSRQGGAVPTPITAQRRNEQPAPDDDWDDSPVIPRLSGMPPRPSILRDPSPMTAMAEQLQPEVIDNRPLPKPLPPIHADPPRRGLDLLPRTYRVTVEDKRRGVDLVPLHRALLGMDGVKDMSLLSYNNGVAIVALDTTSDLDSELLRSCISRAMAREAKVEVHNEHTMVVKLAED